MAIDEQVRAAVEHVHDAIRDGVAPAEAIAEAVEEHGVLGEAVQLRFERQYGCSPGDYASRTFQVVDPALRAWALADEHQLHPTRKQFSGKRFCIETTDEETGEVTRRWFRFVRACGPMVEVLDEETGQLGEVYDPGLIDEIARQTGWQYKK
jgi:hypothetical protein